MGELSDEWSAKRKTNVWGDIPRIMEMQSEAGAAGAIHGALSGGHWPRRLRRRKACCS